MQDRDVKNGKAVWSWGFYDWANSAFTTLILTFVYGTYFSQSIVADPVSGASSWSYAIALSGLFLLFLGPVGGAIADHTGRLKIWIFISSMACLTGVAMMAVGVPSAGSGIILIVLTGLVLANVGFELGIVFYNALLPNVARPSQLGKVSSFGWALGYAGGLLSLILMLLLFIGVSGMGPFIELPKENAWHVRMVIPFVIVWFVIFSIPLFLNVPDRVRTHLPAKEALRRGGISLRSAFGNLLVNRSWRNFLIGSAFYRDGLNTLFAMGGIYAAQKYNLQTSDIMLFGIGMNITAGLGAYTASFFEDRLGSFKVVRISLVGLLIAGIFILLSGTQAAFFISALCLGLFVGPVQSASRTIVSKLSRDDVITENYGLYALTGRAAAFLGPFCYALATDIFQTQNAGIATILFFWALGFAFIRKLV